MRDALRVIDLYPNKLRRAESAWMRVLESGDGGRWYDDPVADWKAVHAARVIEMLVMVDPDLREHLTQQGGRNPGAPNIDIELSENDDDAEAMFSRVVDTRYVGHDRDRGEEFYEEEVETVLCDFDELRDVLDESVSCLTINLTKLAAAPVVIPFD